MLQEYEEALTQYALKEGRAGEEFFAERMRSIRESVAERQARISERNAVSQLNVAEIEAERRAMAGRMNLLPASYMSERLVLKREISALNREERAERVRRLKDVAAWEREKRDKLEEYEGIAQLFRAVAVEGRVGDARR